MSEAENECRDEAVAPLEITHAEMLEARQTGDATSLSVLITDIVRYRRHWWVAYTSGWLRITDESTCMRLDRHPDWANPRLLRDPF